MTVKNKIEGEISSTSSDIGPDIGPLSTDKRLPTETLQVEEQNHEDEEEPVWPTGLKLYINITCVFVARFLLGLDLTIVAVCVPSLTDRFHTVSDIGWYSAAYAMMVCCFNFFFGKLYTLFPTKKLLIIGLIIFEAGSLLCTVAPTSWLFICGRAIAGMGNSAVSGGCSLVVVHSFPNHKRPFWNGLGGGIFSLAMVSAPLLGGALIDAWSWRLCFLINLPLGAIVVASIWFNFREPPPKPQFSLSLKEKAKLADPLGAILMAAGISCFLIALQYGGTTLPWNSPTIIILFVLAFVILMIFGYLQHRFQEKAVLPPRYLKNRTILAAAWFNFCISGTLTVVEQYLFIFFQSVKGYSAGKAGIMAVPLIVGMAISAPLGGWATAKIGYYCVPMYVTTVIAPIAAGFISTVDLHQNNARVLGFLGMLGLAAGFASSSAVSAVQTILKPMEVPSGLAVTSVGGTMGTAISVCVAATLFQQRLLHEVRDQDPSIDISYLSHLGLTEIRKNVNATQLGKVLKGYDEAIDQTLYIPVALTVSTLIGALAVEWRSVKKKSI